MFAAHVVFVCRFSVDTAWFIDFMVDTKESKTSVFGFQNIAFLTDRVDLPLLKMERLRIQCCIHTRVSINLKKNGTTLSLFTGYCTILNLRLAKSGRRLG